MNREGIQLANKHIKRCSTLLGIRKMRIKTTMKYHFIPFRMAIIKKRWTIPSIGEDVEKLEPSPALLVGM